MSTRGVSKEADPKFVQTDTNKDPTCPPDSKPLGSTSLIALAIELDVASPSGEGVPTQVEL